jgi:SSU ribosomal protein S13P
MARIVGVDLPKNKRGEIGLTYIYGIGRSTARKILDEAGISYDLKVQDWSDEQVGAIRSKIADMGIKVEGECRSVVQLNIKRLMDIGCYRGSATVWVFRFAVRAPRTTPARVRARRRPSQTRKRQRSNN